MNPTQQHFDFDMAPLVAPDRVFGASIQDRFESFHSNNPWVLGALESLTVDYLQAGNSRLGIGMLVEVLRWQYGRQTSGDEFKLNNNYRSRYVRLMIERHPTWADVFSTRELMTA